MTTNKKEIYIQTIKGLKEELLPQYDCTECSDKQKAECIEEGIGCSPFDTYIAHAIEGLELLVSMLP